MLVLNMVQDLAFAFFRSLEAKTMTHTRQDTLQLLHCGKKTLGQEFDT